jgi:hypothetical protein
MKKTIFGALVVLLFTQCSKNDTDPNQQQNRTDAVEKPKKITLSFYNQNTLLKKWIYEIDSLDLSALNGVVYWTDSSYNSFPGHSTFSKVRINYTYNASAGMFSEIVAHNYRSGSINHWSNNRVTYEQSNMNNFRLSSPLSLVGPSGIRVHNFSLKLYSDTLQQNNYRTLTNSVYWHWYNNKRYIDVVYGNNGPNNFFEMRHDSIFLREVTVPPPGINETPQMRYSNYYEKELPWYSKKKEDRSIFFIKSPYVCDSFVLRNGEWTFATPTSDGVFSPSLIRKISYQYIGDTTAIKTFIDVINPIIKEPFWFYTAAYAHSLSIFNVKEEGNYNDLYNWLSSRSIDSVFTVTNGQKTFRQATITNNTVEKDAKGRIIKISNRVDGKASYKTIELTY